MKAASVTLPVLLAVLGLVGCSSDQAPPTAPDATNAAAPSASGRIVPPVASPVGKSYGEWAAEWWKWALAPQPASTRYSTQPGSTVVSASPIMFGFWQARSAAA